ncbi:MAG: inositol monophosphatase family protein [Alphaproteobacteria bacterium]
MFRERILTQSAILNVMIEAAFKAGRGLVKDFGEIEKLQIDRKGPKDFVSTADRKAEKTIQIILEKARPGYSYLMEESGIQEGTEPDHRWIVDPLDGTTNFLHGLPGFCVSIAYEHKGVLTAGVIFDPLLDEMFWAEKGKGAFLNSQRLQASSRKDLKESLVITGTHGNEAAQKKALARLEILLGHHAIVRCLGSSALSLAYVAAGRTDGYFEDNLKVWDVSAGKVIVEESRGTLSYDVSGHEVSNLVAGPIGVYEKLKTLLL